MAWKEQSSGIKYHLLLEVKPMSNFTVTKKTPVLETCSKPIPIVRLPLSRSLPSSLPPTPSSPIQSPPLIPLHTKSSPKKNSLLFIHTPRVIPPPAPIIHVPLTRSRPSSFSLYLVQNPYPKVARPTSPSPVVSAPLIPVPIISYKYNRKSTPSNPNSVELEEAATHKGNFRKVDHRLMKEKIMIKIRKREQRRQLLSELWKKKKLQRSQEGIDGVAAAKEIKERSVAEDSRRRESRIVPVLDRVERRNGFEERVKLRYGSDSSKNILKIFRKRNRLFWLKQCRRYYRRVEWNLSVGYTRSHHCGTSTGSLNTAKNDSTNPSFQIFVKTLPGNTITLDVIATDTIKAAKDRIKLKTGILPERLSFTGRELEDDELIGSYEISKESVIHVNSRLSGGMDPYLTESMEMEESTGMDGIYHATNNSVADQSTSGSSYLGLDPSNIYRSRSTADVSSLLESLDSSTFPVKNNMEEEDFSNAVREEEEYDLPDEEEAMLEAEGENEQSTVQTISYDFEQQESNCFVPKLVSHPPRRVSDEGLVFMEKFPAIKFEDTACVLQDSAASIASFIITGSPYYGRDTMKALQIEPASHTHFPDGNWSISDQQLFTAAAPYFAHHVTVVSGDVCYEYGPPERENDDTFMIGWKGRAWNINGGPYSEHTISWSTTPIPGVGGHKVLPVGACYGSNSLQIEDLPHDSSGVYLTSLPVSFRVGLSAVADLGVNGTSPDLKVDGIQKFIGAHQGGTTPFLDGGYEPRSRRFTTYRDFAAVGMQAVYVENIGIIWASTCLDTETFEVQMSHILVKSTIQAPDFHGANGNIGEFMANFYSTTLNVSVSIYAWTDFSEDFYGAVMSQLPPSQYSREIVVNIAQGVSAYVARSLNKLNVDWKVKTGRGKDLFKIAAPINMGTVIGSHHSKEKLGGRMDGPSSILVSGSANPSASGYGMGNPGTESVEAAVSNGFINGSLEQRQLLDDRDHLSCHMTTTNRTVDPSTVVPANTEMVKARNKKGSDYFSGINRRINLKNEEEEKKEREAATLSQLHLSSSSSLPVSSSASTSSLSPEITSAKLPNRRKVIRSGVVTTPGAVVSTLPAELKAVKSARTQAARSPSKPGVNKEPRKKEVTKLQIPTDWDGISNFSTMSTTASTSPSATPRPIKSLPRSGGGTRKKKVTESEASDELPVSSSTPAVASCSSISSSTTSSSSVSSSSSSEGMNKVAKRKVDEDGESLPNKRISRQAGWSPEKFTSLVDDLKSGLKDLVPEKKNMKMEPRLLNLVSNLVEETEKQFAFGTGMIVHSQVEELVNMVNRFRGTESTFAQMSRSLKSQIKKNVDPTYFTLSQLLGRVPIGSSLSSMLGDSNIQSLGVALGSINVDSWTPSDIEEVRNLQSFLNKFEVKGRDDRSRTFYSDDESGILMEYQREYLTSRNKEFLWYLIKTHLRRPTLSWHSVQNHLVKAKKMPRSTVASTSTSSLSSTVNITPSSTSYASIPVTHSGNIESSSGEGGESGVNHNSQVGFSSTFTSPSISTQTSSGMSSSSSSSLHPVGSTSGFTLTTPSTSPESIHHSYYTPSAFTSPTISTQTPNPIRPSVLYPVGSVESSFQPLQSGNLTLSAATSASNFTPICAYDFKSNPASQLSPTSTASFTSNSSFSVYPSFDFTHTSNSTPDLNCTPTPTPNSKSNTTSTSKSKSTFKSSSKSNSTSTSKPYSTSNLASNSNLTSRSKFTSNSGSSIPLKHLGKGAGLGTKKAGTKSSGVEKQNDGRQSLSLATASTSAPTQGSRSTPSFMSKFGSLNFKRKSVISVSASDSANATSASPSTSSRSLNLSSSSDVAPSPSTSTLTPSTCSRGLIANAVVSGGDVSVSETNVEDGARGIEKVRIDTNKSVSKRTGSQVLEVFRHTMGTGRWELDEIGGYLLEFASDQYGCEHIARKLGTASPYSTEMLFQEMKPYIFYFSTHTCAHHLIKRFFDVGTEFQINAMAQTLKHQILELSLDEFGSRVVEMALDHVSPERRVEIFEGLKTHLVRCSRDEYGNRVVRGAINRFPHRLVTFFGDTFAGHALSLATHQYGNLVLTCFIEKWSMMKSCPLVIELVQMVLRLSQDKYGSFVIELIVEKGDPEIRSQIVKSILNQVLPLSQDQYANIIVQKCLRYGTPKQRELLIKELLPNIGNITFHRYGHFVMEKMVEWAVGSQRIDVMMMMESELNKFKKNDGTRYPRGFTNSDKLFHALLDSLPSPSQQGTAGSAAYDYVSPSSARATEGSTFSSHPSQTTTTSTGTVLRSNDQYRDQFASSLDQNPQPLQSSGNTGNYSSAQEKPSPLLAQNILSNKNFEDSTTTPQQKAPFIGTADVIPSYRS